MKGKAEAAATVHSSLSGPVTVNCKLLSVSVSEISLWLKVFPSKNLQSRWKGHWRFWTQTSFWRNTQLVKRQRQIFGICITKRKLIFFIKFMRLYSCVYMEHDKSQGPVAILPRKLLMIKSSWEAGSVPGMCIRDGGMLLAPVELGWIRRWCNPVEIWPQSAREQKCLRCIFYCRLTK